ncbi:MAG: PAC2 family protein [Haloarculaceae archaeon]
MAANPSFEFHVNDDAVLGDRLLVGYASPGMASLIASDYLVTEGQTTQAGYVRVHDLPTITPFNEGVPRYPSRLYTNESGPTMVVSERFLPLEIGDKFAEAIGQLASDHGIEEITILYGIPYPHGPEDHAVFSIATEDYPLSTLEDAGVKRLSGGFLDGVPGTLLQDGIGSDALKTGVYVTPSHPPGPDFDAALRLLEAVDHHFDVRIDTTQLEAQSEEFHRYYEELATRIEAENEDRDFPEDRMYM